METISRRRVRGIEAPVRRRQEQYRWRRQILDAVADDITAGRAADVDTLLEERGGSGAYAGALDLAAAAQSEWWLGVLGRLDAGLEDDIAAVPARARSDAVRQAWAAQCRATPGYPAVAAFGAGDAKHQAAGRRYARLLALFAGAATIADDEETATAAGWALVRNLDDARAVAIEEDATYPR